MSDLQVTISDGPKQGIKIISLTGEMDESRIEPLRQQVETLYNDASIKILLFDLGKLEFINSKGIGYLVSVHTHLSKYQKILVLAAANEAVMDVISLVGLTTIIKYFSSVEEALNVL